MSPRTTARPAATNLPHVASSFVGREADVAALASRFEESSLVTIVGPGGAGKTRLALRFAEEHLGEYAARRGGGVWFCDLSEARRAGEVVATVAASLGLKLAGHDTDAAASEAVGRAIARRGRVLLVLDNFERLAATAPESVGRWLRAAPSARFLVTSRVPLELPGEQRWSLAALPRDEAVELFARRARAVQPSFDPSSDARLAGEIVDAIDRMPLAIELAASRLAVLSAAQLRARLAQSRALLAAGRDDGRHGSMRRTVLDSVELLEPPHRRLFALCAALRNGFTLDAAEAVLGDVAMPRAAVLDGLETLARHSLLRVGADAGDPVARYALFETIRDVADELAAAEPERGEVLRRHASHYAASCERLRREAAARGTADLAALARELENLLHAHATAIALAADDRTEARAREAVAIALGVEPLLSARGLSRLRVRLFDEALASLDATGSPDAPTRAEVLLARGLAHREMGNAAPARADFERALELARPTGNARLIALALMRLGGISDTAGDTHSAQARFADALALLREAPADGARVLDEAEAYVRLGHAHRREGALAPARASIAAAAERYRRLDHDEGLAWAMYELGVVEMFAGAHATAFAHFDEGLRVAQRGGVRVMTGALMTARGGLLQDLGRLDEALAHHAEAAGVFREVGSRFRETSALYYLATTHLERGVPAEAEAVLLRARDLLEGTGAPRYEALINGARACALAALGLPEAAERAMADAEAACAHVRDEPALACNVKIHRLALELRARGWADAERAMAEAEALAREHSNDDSRFAHRALLQAARGTRREPAALVVGAGGSSFTLPDAGAPVALPERSPMRRILEHLARRRIDAPGEVVSVEEVIRVAWPAERIGAAAALNRAYVALATLRKLGLRALLVHGGGGYALSQAVVVRIENKRD